MKILMLIGIALALALDAFAVTVGLSCSPPGLNRRQAFRLAFHFGLFQFIMPLIGWFIGDKLLKLIFRYDHWVAFGFLLIVGLKMIIGSFHKESERNSNQDQTSGWPLLLLALATSQDALAVGLSIAFIGINLWLACSVIGLTAFLMTILASRLGPLLGRVFGRKAELAGGFILILIGIKIIIDHLK